MPVYAWERAFQGWVKRVSTPAYWLLAPANTVLGGDVVGVVGPPMVLLVLPWGYGVPVVAALMVALALIALPAADVWCKQRFGGRGRPRSPFEFGLPSGDCATVVVWSVVALGWAAVLPIALVAWARMARDAHWPLDTVAGVALGLWLALPALVVGR